MAVLAPGIAGDARFSGVIARVALPGTVLAAAVPAGLELPGVEAGEHVAALILFGEQRHGASIRGGIPLPLSSSFFEFGVILPRLRRAGEACACVVRMCSSYPAVVAVGNREYGFHKSLARVNSADGIFSMAGTDGRLQFVGQMQPTGSWSRLRAVPGPVVEEIVALRDRPVFGYRDEGTLVESRFEWDFSAALVRPTSAVLDLDPSLGLAALPLHRETAPGEAVEVSSMTWGLSWPRVAAPH